MKKTKKRVMIVWMCMTVVAGATGCSTQKDVANVNSEDQSEVNDTQISTEEISTEEISTQEMSTQEAGTEEISTQEMSTQEASTEETAAWYIENADLNGHIVNFSDTEISLAVAITETDGNGGEIMIAPAPGMEEEEDLVHVTYSENTKIQILTIHRKNETKISLSDVDKSSIKEQDGVLIFGSCQNTYQWTANKIIIVKYV